jgi:protein gp37
MAKDSKIEWTHHTANLWWGCTEVHEGCDNCYASALSNRWGFDVWGNEKPRRAIKSVWKDLDRFQRLAKEKNEVHRVFVGSMMDIFEKPMKLIGTENENTGNLRFQLFYRIDRGDYPNLMFLLLTKRPSNINKYIFESWKVTPPANVMFGTSVVNQATADKLIPQLLEVKGKRFLSIEPQLDVIDLSKWLLVQWTGHDYIFKPGRIVEGKLTKLELGIHWIINGGESGHGRRVFDTKWATLIRDQCKGSDVPFFMKQIDKVLPIPEDLLIRQFPS